MNIGPADYRPRSFKDLIGVSRRIGEMLHKKCERASGPLKILLYGCPGTGKTELIKMSAVQLTGLPLDKSGNSFATESVNGKNVNSEMIRRWMEGLAYRPMYRFEVKLVNEIDRMHPDSQVLTAGQVLEGYNGRETEESFFRAEQDSFGAHYLRTHHFYGQAAFLWLLASTVNLLRWVQHSQFAGTPLETVGVTKLVTQALRIPATVQQVSDHLWTVTFPETARLIRQLLAAWAERHWQLPLPLLEYSP